MGGHSSRSCTSYETVPPPPIPPHYHVAGILNPNAVGDYFYVGIIPDTENPYWMTNDGNFTIVQAIDNCTIMVGTYIDGYVGWQKDGNQITGVYPNTEEATGIATVTYIP